MNNEGIIASTSLYSQDACKRKYAKNVIAKERSDCGNLNPYNMKNVYLLMRKPQADAAIFISTSLFDIQYSILPLVIPAKAGIQILLFTL